MERCGSGRSEHQEPTHALPIVFTDLDILDINALVSDLNERLDAFLADHVAGDETAGMTALGQVRGQQDVSRDSTGTRDWGLLPGLSSQAIDSFAGRLDQFYAEIDDPGSMPTGAMPWPDCTSVHAAMTAIRTNASSRRPGTL